MSGFAYSLRKLSAEIPLRNYLEDCVNVPRFLACCKECGNYGHVWSCPPYDFDPMDIWNQYATIRLYGRMLLPQPQSQDIDDALRALRLEKEQLLKELLFAETQFPGSLALTAGSCSVCAICSRKSGGACRFPEKMRYSIESLGGDVGLTADRYLGQPLLWIKDAKLPKHLMLVGALLIPFENEDKTVE